MGIYQVKRVSLEGEVPFDDGKMNKYEVDLTPEGGGETYTGVALWLKTDQTPPLEGDKVETEIVDAPRGGKKAKGLRAAGSQPASSGSSGSYGGSDERGRSIERQVALKAAAEITAAAVGNGKAVPTEATVKAAEAFDAFLSGGSDLRAEAEAAKSDDDIPF